MTKKNIYWGAMTTAGMQTIAQSELTGIQIRLFFGLIIHLMDKETNQIPQTNKDILTNLTTHDINIGKATLYRGLEALCDNQLITPLWADNEEQTRKHGYMVNPFLIYFGRKPELKPKLNEFERLAKLEIIDNTYGESEYKNTKFVVSDDIFKTAHPELEPMTGTYNAFG